MSNNTAPPAPSPSSSSAEPFETYYDPANKSYLVPDDAGGWTCVSERGLIRMLNGKGLSSKKVDGALTSAVDNAIIRYQTSRNVAHAGPLAGYDAGLHIQDGNRILVTKGPTYVDPVEGDWSMLHDIYRKGLVTDGIDQTVYHFSWLKLSEASLRSKSFIPAPATVLAGPVNSCKTLFGIIGKHILGGRSAFPYRYMMDRSNFNKDLFGAENLIIDDEVSAVDNKTRAAFGCQIKVMLFAGAQSSHGKNKDAFSLRPFWRLWIMVNDTGDHLRILPPLEDSINDKIMMLRTTAQELPMPTTNDEEQDAFWAVLSKQIPAFVWFLRNQFVIPNEIKDPRTGIMAFKHPRLLMAIREQMVEIQLMKMIDEYIFDHPTITVWKGSSRCLCAAIPQRTTLSKSEADMVQHPPVVGKWLNTLAEIYPGRFSYQRTENDRIWTIHAPTHDSTDSKKTTSIHEK